MLRPIATLFAFILLCAQAAAVIVSGSDGTQNTTAPADDFGFANVGRIFDTSDSFFTSGVYLGNGWMISGYHEVRDGAGGFVFGNVLLSGSSFTVDASSAVRLTTTGTFGTVSADLALFRLTALPNLPSVSISATKLPNFASVLIMGNGVNRDPALTNWIVSSGTNPTWTETSGTGTQSGYKLIGGQSLRWGTNNLGAGISTFDDGFGETTFISTTFDNSTNEAQVATGDSGGGLFYKRNSSWELAGILLATGGEFQNQPAGTAVFGNTSFAANLSTYHDQIAAVIPEPNTLRIFIVGFLSLTPFFLRRTAKRWRHSFFRG